MTDDIWECGFCHHKTINKSYCNNCKRDRGHWQWQPHTHMQSKQEASTSAGTSDFQNVPESQQLFQILQQVTALQQNFAGISLSRHNPFLDFMNPQKDDITDAIQSQTSASIANLHQMVMDLYTRVLAAELGLLTNSGDGMRKIYWDPQHAPLDKI
jgi:hypothetical protein